jgi:hypothetical protein
VRPNQKWCASADGGPCEAFTADENSSNVCIAATLLSVQERAIATTTCKVMLACTSHLGVDVKDNPCQLSAS